MAIAPDNSLSSYQGTALGLHTFSYTTGTISDGIMLVGIRIYDAGDRIGPAEPTYAGVTMTQLTKNALGGDYMYLYYLLNPAAGTNNLVVDVREIYRCEVGIITLSGAKQSGQPDATATGSGSSTDVTATLTTVASGSVGVLFGVLNGASGALTSGTDCTVAAYTTDRSGIGYSGAKSPAGSLAMHMTAGGTGAWGALAASVAPAQSATSGFFSIF